MRCSHNLPILSFSLSPVEFLYGVSGGFPHVGRKVSGRLFDGQHHDGYDDGNSDAGENPEGARSDQLIWILNTHTMCKNGLKYTKRVLALIWKWEKWEVSVMGGA